MQPILAIELGPWELARLLVVLLGGLALFLLGLELLSGSLRALAGGAMQKALGAMTKNRFVALVSGVGVTAVLQSSSITTVLIVGFISAGLMSMTQSVGVVMGANIGKTITAQIIAFDIDLLSYVLLAGGFLIAQAARRKRLGQIGRVVMASGLIFFSMQVMSDAMSPLRDDPRVLDLMGSLRNPWVGILVGAAFTALVQSSAATMGVVISLAGQQLISLEAGVAVALGANIGTCITAMLASIGRPREAVRAALVHVLFNVIGVLAWVWIIDRLIQLVLYVSPSDVSVARAVANAHTIFNIINALVLVWFAGVFAWIVNRIVPIRENEVMMEMRPMHLDRALLDTPALALSAARRECERLGRLASDMVRDAPHIVLTGELDQLRELRRRDDAVDDIHEAIIEYLGRISERELSARETKTLYDLTSVANYFEQIGDVVEMNLYRLGRSRTRRQVAISKPTTERIEGIAAMINEACDLAVKSVAGPDAEAAEQLVNMKGEVNESVDDAQARQVERLSAQAPDRLTLYAIEADIIESLKRVYYFAKRIGKVALETRYLTDDEWDEPANDAPGAPPGS